MQSVQRSFAECQKKCTVVWPPVMTPHPTYEIWGNALDAKRLVFCSFFVLFLMEVRYNQTELSSVKKNNLSSSHSCCGHGTSLNTFVFAYPSAGVQEKHVFLPRLNCSAHWEWSAWIQQGFLFQSFHFGKLLWVLNFTKRTNCPSLLLSISFSFIGCPLSSCHLILLPAWIFLTTQYTVARGMPVHFFFFLHFQFLHWFFQK